MSSPTSLDSLRRSSEPLCLEETVEGASVTFNFSLSSHSFKTQHRVYISGLFVHHSSMVGIQFAPRGTFLVTSDERLGCDRSCLISQNVCPFLERGYFSHIRALVC